MIHLKIEKVLSVFINGSVKHFTVVWVLEVGDCRNPGLFRPPPPTRVGRAPVFSGWKEAEVCGSVICSLVEEAGRGARYSLRSEPERSKQRGSRRRGVPGRHRISLPALSPAAEVAGVFWQLAGFVLALCVKQLSIRVAPLPHQLLFN